MGVRICMGAKRSRKCRQESKVKVQAGVCMKIQGLGNGGGSSHGGQSVSEL